MEITFIGVRYRDIWPYIGEKRAGMCNIYRPTFPVLPCILPYKSCITFYTDIFQAIHATQYMIRELLLHSIEFISIYSWPELRLIPGIYRFTLAYIFIYSTVTFYDANIGSSDQDV